MGVCCARTESINEEVLNSFHKSDNDLDILKVPELLYESKKYEKKMLNSSINDLISNLTQAFGNITKKITFIELFNISLKFQDNYTNSNYLVYDLREHEDQTDNFVKKMKHINYSYDELKVLSQDKISNFRRFINNKTIIFIFPDYNSSNKVNNNKIQIENNNNNSNRNNNNGNIEQKIIMYSELITMLIELNHLYTYIYDFQIYVEVVNLTFLPLKNTLVQTLILKKLLIFLIFVFLLIHFLC